MDSKENLDSIDASLRQKIKQEFTAIKYSDILQEDMIEIHIKFIWNTLEKLKRKKEQLVSVIDNLVESNLKGGTERILSLLEENKEKLATTTGVFPENVRNFLSIVWVGTDVSCLLCHQFVCSSVIIRKTSRLLDFLSDVFTSESVLFVIKFILGCWHNCLRHASSAARIHFREIDSKLAIQKTIHKYEDNQMVVAKGIIVLSYLLIESEKDDSILENEVLGFIIQILSQAVESEERVSRRHGMSVQEILQGINNLSVNDKNKEELVKRKSLPIFVKILKEKRDQEEVLQTLTIIWRISFLDQNFPKLISDADLVSVIESLQFDKHERIRHSATGALWEMRQRNMSIDCIKDDPRPHVMISYQWDSQKVMLKVKDFLKQAGYKVWMDVENISGSTVEAMSLAIENAAVVLICMSQRYKESPSCRSEAEYSYKLRKCVVPLRVEPRYVPDGWLGIIIGTRLYFDFTPEKQFDHMMENLIKELGSKGRIFDNIDGMVSIKQQSKDNTEEKISGSWTKTRMNGWLDSCDLSKPSKRLYDLNFELLSELRLLQTSSPATFYDILRSDLLLSGVDVIKFSQELRKLSDI
ncbi:uncharacterized protein LOC125646315 [Ostrea edulis]|uniref:uncharacterized protein LOC125646315 n=1 Tax=Ostrea edulis TaxID=37623 RepID=UPI0024AFFE82|nr:uncharacterized protein LOC125646315 [Ostrea edulis]